jgi:hypothetical protein
LRASSIWRISSSRSATDEQRDQRAENPDDPDDQDDDHERVLHSSSSLPPCRVADAVAGGILPYQSG